ncbi:MAG: hypothetical protein Q4C73_09460 [Eubacteriales bacterium]|nr:hypothetical protein [Eubacteriales bacterium]
MEVASFVEKLNRVDGKAYTIEEHIVMPESGVYEAALEHDNISEGSLTVYTGPGLTGEPVQGWALSTPSLTPWKQVIRIYTDHPEVYICYVTKGDTVEADDINALQDEMVRTQLALKEHEDSVEEITEAEIDRLDDIIPEDGGGSGSCGCQPITEQEITEVLGRVYEEGGMPVCGCEPLTQEEIEEVVS